jgi:hypothetical protein
MTFTELFGTVICSFTHDPMIGQSLLLDLLCRKTWDISEIYWHIGQISRYLKKYRNIGISKLLEKYPYCYRYIENYLQMSISLSILKFPILHSLTSKSSEDEYT